MEDLEQAGFKGFNTVESLWDNSSYIPKERGVYLVLRVSDTPCKYLVPGTGGFFKNKNPNIELKELENNWVHNAKVVYIGKAGSLEGSATLHSRLNQYLKFGKGKNIGHWGGRLIWQLKDSSELVICWKPLPSEDPRSAEKELIKAFVMKHGKRPFANLTD